MSRFNFRISKERRDWYGFSVPKGAAFGTEFFCVNGVNRRYDYVYVGDIKYIHRPDGTVAGKKVKIFIHHHRESWKDYSVPDSGYYRPIWVECRKNSLAEKLLNRHIKPDFQAEPEFHVKNLQNFSSAIRRPSSAGAIFNMVRERQ